MQTTTIILSHIPTWVWAIFAALVVMGVVQSRDQWVPTQRLMILPLVWMAYGMWGIYSAFGLQAAPLLAWGAGLALSATLVLRAGWPGGAHFDAARRLFFVPGSWLPMGLMMGLFVGKFALGMSLAMQPAVAHNIVAALGFSATFGVLSGVFLGRSRAILGRAPSTGAVAAA
ncbi:hypothetical protein BH11PSE10_BH11PSE10_04680 [soil metagenome]